MPPKKIALVADWITHWGGAERILVKLMEMYPEADIYTSVFFPERPEFFQGRKVHKSFIQYIPYLNKRHKLCMLLRPLAFWFFSFQKYDLVISSSSAEAKGIITKRKESGLFKKIIHAPLIKGRSDKFTLSNEGGKLSGGGRGDFSNLDSTSRPPSSDLAGMTRTKHICYCHTPTRYLWSHSEAYRNFLEFGWLNWLAKLVIPSAFKIMRKWDYRAAQRPDIFIANSATTQTRIAEYYNRESVVVYPFYNSNEQGIMNNEKGRTVNNSENPQLNIEHGTLNNYFVCLGRIVPYKRFDLAIMACNQLGFNLRIFTNTQNAESERLQKLSGPTIEWIFGARDAEVGDGLEKAQGFIMPQVEDFGIVSLEAMSYGTPVIAYGEGGATETVVHGKTGLLFSEQTVESLVNALEKSRVIEWDRSVISLQSALFSEERFEAEFRKVADSIIA